MIFYAKTRIFPKSSFVLYESTFVLSHNLLLKRSLSKHLSSYKYIYLSILITSIIAENSKTSWPN